MNVESIAITVFTLALLFIIDGTNRRIDRLQRVVDQMRHKVDEIDIS